MASTDQRVTLTRIGNYDMTGKCLGKGSYAKVYESVHRFMKVTVAMKTMNISEMKDSYMKKNFKREATLLSRLNHPGIVSLFEVFETRNHYCMAVEFGGENLCDFVRAQKRGRLDEQSSRFIGRQLTAAVSHIHKNLIVHRDIKLENILVIPATKKVKLTDFGLSNTFDKKNLLTTHCGSPEYAAPELHQGRAYGFEVDIWALGVVLFAMAVGRLPFEVEMKKPVSNQHRRELFLEETKRGVKTMKHQNFMASASFLLKDLVSKMLNPNRPLRLKIHQVEKHQWIQGVLVEEFEPITAEWQEETLQKIAKTSTVEVDDVVDELGKNPYGKLGGFYNIEKRLHQLKTMALKKAPSCSNFRIAETTNSAKINRPTTSIGNSNFISAVEAMKRPKSAHRKSALLKPFESNLRGEKSKPIN